MMMGKKRLRKVLGEKVFEAKEEIKRLIQTQTTVNDDNYILRVISPTHLELEPINMSVEELHIKCIKRMDSPKYRNFYSKFNIYISEDNKKVVMKI